MLGMPEVIPRGQMTKSIHHFFELNKSYSAIQTSTPHRISVAFAHVVLGGGGGGWWRGLAGGEALRWLLLRLRR